MAWSRPDLFVLGAAKCGTSTLHAYLDLHPDIEMSRHKEPRFFSFVWDEAAAADDLAAASDAYLSCWSGRARVSGEASVTYFTHPEAPYRIASRVRAPKAIILLRDPVERAWSNYLHATTKEGPMTQERHGFRRAVDEDLDRMARATVTPDALRRSYVRTGMYAQHVRRAWDALGRDNVHITFTADLQASPQRVLYDIAGFLALPRDGFRAVASLRKNEAHTPRGNAARWLLASRGLRRTGILRLAPERLRSAFAARFLITRDGLRMSTAMRKRLEDLFEPDIQELEDMLGRPLPMLRASWANP